MARSLMGNFMLRAVLLAGIACGSQNVRADYGSYIAGTSPVGWWGMNETGGNAQLTTADLSGTYGAANNQAGVNLNLTYQGVGAGSLPTQAGFVYSSTGSNYSTYFDGASASGAFGNSPDNLPYNTTGLNPPIYRYPGGFAAEVWIKPDGTVATDSERVIATREFGFGFEVTATRGLHFTTFAKQDYKEGQVGTTWTSGTAANSVPLDGNFHQIGVSFDGNVTTNFYIDGAWVGTCVSTNGGIRTSNTVANTINLTHRNTDVQHFKGWLDEAVIWGTTRTDQDFADSYAAALAPVPEPASLGLLAVTALGGWAALRRRFRK